MNTRLYNYKIFLIIHFNLKDGVGKWPTEFDGKSYHLQEVQTKNWWKMTLNVKEIQDFKKLSPEVQDEILRDMENCELVLTYLSTPSQEHAIYAAKYNASKKTLKCVDSAGEVEPYPRVPIRDVLHLYKVTCTAVMDKMENYGPNLGQGRP